ncbi:hypothetical protein D3C71_2049610 [compost metagenome]
MEIRNTARKIGVTKIAQKHEYIVFEPSNLKYRLTNKDNNDILASVQIALQGIQKMLIKEKGN